MFVTDNGDDGDETFTRCLFTSTLFLAFYLTHIYRHIAVVMCDVMELSVVEV